MIGYRKFTVVIFALTLGALLAERGKLTGAQFVELAIWTAGAYVLGNVGSKLADKLKVTVSPAVEEKK